MNRNICLFSIYYTLSVNVNPIQDKGANKASYQFFPYNFYKRKT